MHFPPLVLANRIQFPLSPLVCPVRPWNGSNLPSPLIALNNYTFLIIMTPLNHHLVLNWIQSPSSAFYHDTHLFQATNPSNLALIHPSTIYSIHNKYSSTWTSPVLCPVQVTITTTHSQALDSWSSAVGGGLIKLHITAIYQHLFHHPSERPQHALWGRWLWWWMRKELCCIFYFN